MTFSVGPAREQTNVVNEIWDITIHKTLRNCQEYFSIFNGKYKN